jgi:UDP-3-O-[3-hydroxymyristoyl] glucosamine N-acyltransferase
MSRSPKARIGADALILQGARIGARVTIGDRFICQPGAVIGADGFSFVTPEKSGVEEIRETLGTREDQGSKLDANPFARGRNHRG